MNLLRNVFSSRSKISETRLRDVEILRRSPLLDPVWYRSNYADVRTAPIDVARHYLEHGARERRNPSEFFDTAFYLEHNADVAASGMNPLVHYIMYGAKEGRNPHPQLAAEKYFVDHPNIDFKTIDPLLHCVETHHSMEGHRRVREPLEDGAPANRPREGGPEAAHRGRNDPHSEEIEILRNSPFLDPDWCRQHYPDLRDESIDIARHYLERGAAEGRDPHWAFDTKFYLERNPDVAAAGLNPLVHYIAHGASEGRQPHPKFDRALYLTRHPDVRFNAMDPLLHCVENYTSMDWERQWPPAQLRKIIAPEFDERFYRRQGPTIGEATAIDHFIITGWRQGYDPSAQFSVSHYLSLNPDARNSDLNPLYHFIMWGRSEGRSPKRSNRRRLAPSSALEPILFVGHDASKKGAQVVLLEIVRWYAEHTRRPISVLLLENGHMVDEYAQYADVFVLQKDMNVVMELEQFRRFIDKRFVFAYVNTVASGDFHVIYDRFLKPRNVPLIVHVHELENVINVFLGQFRQLKARARSFIAVSDQVMTCLIDKFGCDERKVLLSNAFIRPIAPTANDVAEFRAKARVALGIDAGDFVVAGCGTVYWRKGPDLFVETAVKAVAAGLTPNVKFIWIGDGEDLEKCRAAAGREELMGRVQFIGFVPRADELLAGADIFYLASREDPFPLVCLEAAQFAVPTLYFEGATGISEFSGADAGVGVPSFDTEACARALCELAGDRATLRRLGEIARERLLAGYTAEIRIKHIAQYVQAIGEFTPEVSIIVPAYNNSEYIQERLESILDQSIQDFEILILDDCSTDQTVRLIAPFTADLRVSLIQNEVNSGTPFKQWKLGSDIAKAPLLWIAEGDDSASANLLETLLPAFDDSRVSLAFCSSIIMDSEGRLKPGALDPYHAMSTFPFHEDEVVVDGFAAVEHGFASMCLIVNASSALLRKSAVAEGIAAAAASYRISGDWLVYLHALKNGMLFYSRNARNYFRRHTESTVHKNEGTPRYFEERHAVERFVVKNFNLSRGAFRYMLAMNENEWRRFLDRNPGKSKDALLRHAALRAARAEHWKIARLRIGFYVHGMLFSKGGIERLAAGLANSLTRRGHSVSIFCRVWDGEKPVYDVNESVGVVPIFDENDIEGSIPRLRLEVARRDLDCFVPMLSEWLFEPIVEAVDAVGVPIAVSEHNDPWKIEELWWSRSRRIACFEKTKAIHLLLERFRTSLPEHLASKIEVIPNGIRLDTQVMALGLAGRPKRFAGIGRLVRQKRFDRLIGAFARIEHEIPGWRLDVFGDGSERAMLQELIEEKGVGDRVCLRGESATILEELGNSAVFVIPSEFEGFGLVVVEAKMAGLPVVGYADCNGPNELVRHEVDGLLVEHDEGGENLGAAMLALATDEEFRLRLASRARENIADFDIERTVERWERLLARTACVKEAPEPIAPLPAAQIFAEA